MRILPSGSGMSRQIFHSCWWRGLATSNEYAPALIFNISGATSRKSMSWMRGPWLSP